MNNPVAFVQMMRNPQAFLQNMMNNSQIMQNPMARNAIEMYKNGDNDGLKAMAENLCKERGTTPDAVKNQIMKNTGMN